MTNKEILQSDLLDIVFEHRNKLYGAYALRKTYDRRLTLALVAALVTVIIFLGISFLRKRDNGIDPDKNNRSAIFKTIELEKEKPKPETKKDQSKPPVATRKYQTPVVVPDKDADTAIVRNEDLENAAIGDRNIDGEVPVDPAKAVTTDEVDGDEKKEQEEAKQPERPTYPPEFPGGNAAWHAFLQRHLQAPEDLEPQQKVEVLVRFWVDVDGSVSKPEIIKSGGSSFDKEVLRVLRKMPKWKPAMQYGNHVAVSYTQPVTFMGVEQ
jgi:periplasmic protein TonB